MTIEDIPNLLTAVASTTLVEHRHQNLELRRDWRQEHGQKISALANKTNLSVSWLVVGVNDDGTLEGHSEQWAKNTEEIISQHINSNLNPNQACIGTSCHEVNGSWIIIIKIKNPGAVAYWGQSAYKAAGSTLAKMTSQEVIEMTVTLPGITDFSAQKWDGPVDSSLVAQFARMLSSRSGEDFDRVETLAPEAVLRRVGIRERAVAKILFANTAYRLVYHDANGEPISNVRTDGLFRLLTDEFIEEIQNWTRTQLGAPTSPTRDALFVKRWPTPSLTPPILRAPAT